MLTFDPADSQNVVVDQFDVDHNDDDSAPAAAITFAKYLVGRRVVEVGTIREGRGLYDCTLVELGRTLRLDDGTVLQLRGNDGCGGCTSGEYDVTQVATVDNAITACNLDIYSDATPDQDCYRPEDGYVYRLHVYTAGVASSTSLFTVAGDDGNGYYGSGFEVTVTRPTTTTGDQ